MTDDTIRNIKFNTAESIYSVQKSNDKPLRKEKRKKKYDSKREKDNVELSEESLSKITNHDSKPTRVHSDDETEKQARIDILVK